jgi:hypothetical protein
MTSVLVPMWILGGPFIALLVLNSLFKGGPSAMRDGHEHGYVGSDIASDRTRADRATV